MRRIFPREKNVSELAEGEYVAVIGTVVGRDDADYAIVLDDGTGSVRVQADRIFQVGDVVCAMGRTEKDETLLITDALIIELGSFSRDLYARLKAMEAGP